MACNISPLPICDPCWGKQVLMIFTTSCLWQQSLGPMGCCGCHNWSWNRAAERLEGMRWHPGKVTAPDPDGRAAWSPLRHGWCSPRLTDGSAECRHLDSWFQILNWRKKLHFQSIWSLQAQGIPGLCVESRNVMGCAGWGQSQMQQCPSGRM